MWAARCRTSLRSHPRRRTATTPSCSAWGAEASVRDRKEFRRRFGCYVVEGYTSSEGGVSINPFPGMPEDALGRPPEGTDVAIIDTQSGTECARAVFGPSREILNATVAIGEI